MKGRRILAYLCFFVAFAIIWPLVSGIVHEGMMFAVLFIVMGILFYSPKWYKKLCERVKWINVFLRVCCSLAVAVCVVISLLMFSATLKKPSGNGTVVILGCQVKDSQPSLMLVRRMDMAIEYLNEHPDVAVIATGAQGKGENMPESKAIYDYLINNGIDAKRIYVEGRSLNTEQNLRFSAGIIKKNGLDEDVIISSDGFHQYRASIFAKRNGLNPSALSSATPIFVCVSYWFREIIGIMRLVVLGY